jgi:hypothetical protein
MNGQYSVTLTAVAPGTVTAAAADGSSNTPSFTLTDATVAITSFSASEGTNHLWTLSGTVDYSGRSTMGLVVYFGGAPVSLANQMTAADGSGHFQLSLTLNGTSTDNGTASAQVVTPWGDYSASALANVQQTGT